MSRRVLLASMNAGGGHHALRDAFATALGRVDPRHDRVEPVVWTSADRFVDWFYSLCVRRLPRFQGTIYDLSNQAWAIEVAMRLSPQLLTEATALLRAERFDLITTTHPLQSMVFVRAREALGLSTPIVCAVPDYGVSPSAYWPPREELRADALIVMEESTLAHFRALGIPDDRLHMSGFLTREPFVSVGARRRSGARDAVRAALKAQVEAAVPEFASFRLDRPTVVFLGGSAWTEKTEPVLRALLADAELAAAVNVVVVCGRGAQFEASLRKESRDGLHVFGYVSGEVLAALAGLADVPVLGSLAPATLQELLEVGLGPLLLFHFIPGSERAHVGYIEQQRLGLYEPDAQAMLGYVREALGVAPASERLATARDGYAERARLLRSRSVERALELPRFLESVAGPPPAAEGHAPASAANG